MSDDGYRVEGLAERAGLSVDTIRYYQHRGLLEPPQRRGRVAFYSEAHLARLARIKELKEQGLSLETIRRILNGIHPADAALVAAVAGAGDGDATTVALSLAEVAAEAGVPPPLLESLVAEGLLVPRNPGAERPYTRADVRAVRAGLSLLDAGLPLSDLLTLGTRYSAAVREIADEAVALFDEHIRRPTRERESPDEAREHLLEAFARLLPAASALVAHNFERAIIQAAHRRIEETAQDGDSDSHESRSPA